MLVARLRLAAIHTLTQPRFCLHRAVGQIPLRLGMSNILAQMPLEGPGEAVEERLGIVGPQGMAGMEQELMAQQAQEPLGPEVLVAAEVVVNLMGRNSITVAAEVVASAFLVQEHLGLAVPQDRAVVAAVVGLAGPTAAVLLGMQAPAEHMAAVLVLLGGILSITFLARQQTARSALSASSGALGVAIRRTLQTSN